MSWSEAILLSFGITAGYALAAAEIGFWGVPIAGVLGFVVALILVLWREWRELP